MDAHEPVNILMVDDQPDKLLSYEIILRELGEHLIMAGSAREALEYLLHTDMALILLESQLSPTNARGGRNEACSAWLTR